MSKWKSIWLKGWNMSDERTHIETLMTQRVHFLLLFFTFTILGAFNTDQQLLMTILLWAGAIVCVLLAYTIKLAQNKLNEYTDNGINAFKRELAEQDAFGQLNDIDDQLKKLRNSGANVSSNEARDVTIAVRAFDARELTEHSEIVRLSKVVADAQATLVTAITTTVKGNVDKAADEVIIAINELREYIGKETIRKGEAVAATNWIEKDSRRSYLTLIPWICTAILVIGAIASLPILELIKAKPAVVGIVDQHVEYHGDSGPNIYSEEIGSIMPFESGIYAVDSLKLASLWSDMKSKVGDLKNLQSLTFVGSADKRPLKGNTEKQIGSNVELARQRAENVKDRVCALLDKEGIKCGSLSIKVETVGGRIDSASFNEDRSVTVYATWTKPSPSSQDGK